ncbi:coagulation factor IXb [Oryzias melastigma]|uniref:Coagulation factor IX n=1 Tax=Oryzias melastigma TaxID=30732 RepID=A0A3B3BLH8_ORYME|nr:coagulation factor IXb [Oryzias melastigma]
MSCRAGLLLFLLGLQLEMYGLRAESTQENTGPVFVSQQTAHTVLRRQRRFNSGHLEEFLQKDNLERECKEEVCTMEEAREVFENHEKTMEFWAIYIDGDQCDPPPCLNGGVCQDGMSSYLCWCKPNFRGKNCEIDINQCSINNGGCMHFCVMQAQRVVCHCAAGYKLGLDKTSCEPTEEFSCGRVNLGTHTRSIQRQQTSNYTFSPRTVQNSTTLQEDDYYEDDLMQLSDYFDLLFNESDVDDISHKAKVKARSVEPDSGPSTGAEGGIEGDTPNTPPEANQDSSWGFPTMAPIKLKKNYQHRIVGGDVAFPGEIPWQVTLMTRPQSQNRAQPFCGGSLLSEFWVITAAHCLTHVELNFIVRAGEHDVNVDEGPERDHVVAQKHIHPSYNPRISEYNHDIALLKLATPVELSNQRRPICLGPKFFIQNLVREATSSLVSGWGKLRFYGPEATKLQKLEIPYVERPVCKESSSDQITRFMFCAGFADQQKDSCKGDSGGPHATNYKGTWFLTGIVSWGEECAKEGKYGIYTRVSHYYPWIVKITGIRMTN